MTADTEKFCHWCDAKNFKRLMVPIGVTERKKETVYACPACDKGIPNLNPPAEG